jgi:hypothetical protein
MTKQLTNKQLDIITDIIFEKVIDGYEIKKHKAKESYSYSEYKKQLKKLKSIKKAIDDYQEAYRKASNDLDIHKKNFNNQFQKHDLQIQYYSSDFEPKIEVNFFNLKRKINQQLILFHSTNDMDKLIDLIVKKLID